MKGCGTTLFWWNLGAGDLQYHESNSAFCLSAVTQFFSTLNHQWGKPSTPRRLRMNRARIARFWFNIRAKKWTVLLFKAGQHLPWPCRDCIHRKKVGLHSSSFFHLLWCYYRFHFPFPWQRRKCCVCMCVCYCSWITHPHTACSYTQPEPLIKRSIQHARHRTIARFSSYECRCSSISKVEFGAGRRRSACFQQRYSPTTLLCFASWWHGTCSCW